MFEMLLLRALGMDFDWGRDFRSFGLGGLLLLLLSCVLRMVIDLIVQGLVPLGV